MPYTVDWEIRGVVIDYSGDVSAAEVLACHQSVYDDVRFNELRFAIVNTLMVRSMPLTRADVEEIDAYLQGPARTNPNIALVIVATHPDVLSAISGHVADHDGAFSMQVCDSVDTARALIAESRKSFRFPTLRRR